MQSPLAFSFREFEQQINFMSGLQEVLPAALEFESAYSLDYTPLQKVKPVAGDELNGLDYKALVVGAANLDPQSGINFLRD